MGPIVKAVVITITDTGNSDMWSYYSIKDNDLIMALQDNWTSQNQGFRMMIARLMSKSSRREWFTNVWGAK